MDNSWVETCSFQVAKDAKEFLDEVCEQMDLAKTEIFVERFPPAVFDPAFNYDYAYDELYISARADVANMLVARGALVSVERTVNNGEVAFRVVAEEQVARTVRNLLKRRIDKDLGIPPPDEPIRDKFA